MHPNEIVVNDYVDEALNAADRAGVERHLAGCAECRAHVDDLRQIRRATASLGDREPPVRAWMRIERAIELERQHAADERSGARRLQPGGGAARATAYLQTLARLKRSRSMAAVLAAAAVVVLATAVTLRYGPIGRGTSTGPGTATPSGPSAATVAAAQAVESELRAAEQHYENAIKGLEQIATAEQNVLDPTTAATVRKNLAVIDQAINESRAALRVQPASEPAQQSLIESFKAKIALLQDTVALINEMRKGNETAGGRVVSGFKQKGD
jgi:anti-sigma factor RsiW